MKLNGNHPNAPRFLPLAGCLGLTLSAFLLCLLPFFLVDAMRAALEKLHLEPRAALFFVIGMFIGGLINIPLVRLHREEEQVVETAALVGVWGWMPQLRQTRRETIIAG